MSGREREPQPPMMRTGSGEFGRTVEEFVIPSPTGRIEREFPSGSSSRAGSSRFRRDAVARAIADLKSESSKGFNVGSVDGSVDRNIDRNSNGSGRSSNSSNSNSNSRKTSGADLKPDSNTSSSIRDGGGNHGSFDFETRHISYLQRAPTLEMHSVWSPPEAPQMQFTDPPSPTYTDDSMSRPPAAFLAKSLTFATFVPEETGSLPDSADYGFPPPPPPHRSTAVPTAPVYQPQPPQHHQSHHHQEGPTSPVYHAQPQQPQQHHHPLHHQQERPTSNKTSHHVTTTTRNDQSLSPTGGTSTNYPKSPLNPALAGNNSNAYDRSNFAAARLSDYEGSWQSMQSTPRPSTDSRPRPSTDSRSSANSHGGIRHGRREIRGVDNSSTESSDSFHLSKGVGDSRSPRRGRGISSGKSPLRSRATSKSPLREQWTRPRSPAPSASPGHYGGMWEGAGAAWGNAHSFGFALSPMIGGEIDINKVRRMRNANDFYRRKSPRHSKYNDDSESFMYSPGPSQLDDTSRWKDRDLSSNYEATGFRLSVASRLSPYSSRHGSRRTDVLEQDLTGSFNSDGNFLSRESVKSPRSRRKAGYLNLESAFGVLGDEPQWAGKIMRPQQGRDSRDVSNVGSFKSDYSEQENSHGLDNLSRGSHTSVGDGDGPPSYDSVSSEESEEELEEEPPQAVGFFGLFRFADWFDCLLMIVGSVGAVVNGGSLPWYSLLFGDLVNTIATHNNDPKLMFNKVQETCLFMVCLSIVVFIGTYLEVACWMLAADRQATRIRIKYLRAVLRQDVSYFDIEISTGVVMNNISYDVATIQDSIGEKVGNFIHHMATFVMGYTVGCLKSWQVSLVVLAATPLMMICGQLQRAVYIGLAAKEERAYQQAGNLAEQAVSAIRTVYSFVAEDGLVREYSKLLEKTMPYGLRVGFARGAGIGTIYLVMYGTWALAMWYGSVLVYNGKLTGGAAITTFFAVITGGKGLGLAAPYLANFAQGGVAAARVFSILDRVPVIDSDDVNGDIPDRIRGEVVLRRVNFSYPARPEIGIFKDLTLRVPPGQTVALVGPSGSGKSTVFALLERFYDPDSGSVLLDGLDIKDLQLTWLRRQIGMVGQEPVLYATSLGENIMYGRDGATMTDVIVAAQAANAHTFISNLPQGYETQVGERGVQMSGGQKQRVAIARAILKNPKVLLLDEATSALDSESETLVQEALDRMLVGRTTIVIAHRLSTIRNVDSIAVIQNGGVVEMGNHDTLIAKRGAYYSLVNQNISGVANGEKRSGLSSAYVTPETTPLHYAAAGGHNQSGKSTPPRPSVTSELHKHVQATSPHKTQEKDVSLSRLLKMSMEELPLLFVGMLNAIHAGLIFPFFGLIMGIVVSVYFDKDKNKMRSDVALWASVYIGLGVAAIVSMTGQHGFFNWAGIKLTKRVREQLLQSLLRQEVGWFDADENSSGAIIARLSVDSAYIRGMFGDRFSIMAMGITAIGVGLIICLVLQWKMTIVSISVTPFFIGSSYAGAMLHLGMTGRDDDYASASSIASDAVSNIRTVASFCSEDKIVDLFNQALSVPLKRSFRRAQIAGFSLGLSQCLMYGSYTLTLWYGSILVKHHEAGFDRVIKVFLILIMSSFSVGQIAQMAPDSSKCTAAVRAVFSVIDRKPVVDANLNQEKGRIKGDVKGTIEFSKVNFSYPARPGISIFSSFSLKIKPGTTMALVGPSGGGKSTVISLLLRFYDPEKGKITLDGVDIRTLNGKWLRRQMALVGQEPILFATTIIENIAFGLENPSLSEIEQACRNANVHDFISSLPDGYNTQVGERGVQLSGGQKQRIAIARAIVRNPKIFLLDEATSALDTESEKKVQEALEKVTKSKTTLIVAHRLSTIRNADGIAVVKNGKVVELGNHERLMGKAGEYFALVNSQAQAMH